MEFHFRCKRSKSKNAVCLACEASYVNEFVLPFSFVQHETHSINKFNVWVWAIECVGKKQIEKLVVRDLECGVRVKHKL